MARREAHRAGGEGLLGSVPAPRRRDSASALDLEAAMDKLPGGARDVFVLFDVEGYRHDEIAGLMGISVGTSKSQLHRARKLLREELR